MHQAKTSSSRYNAWRWFRNSVWEEHWIETFNSIGLATFMVDSNWARRKCKKNLKKQFQIVADVHQGVTRIVDGYHALELLSKHPRIDPARIGCLAFHLELEDVSFKCWFQKMWGTPGLKFAASVPLYPPCNVRFKEDDEITDFVFM